MDFNQNDVSIRCETWLLLRITSLMLWIATLHVFPLHFPKSKKNCVNDLVASNAFMIDSLEEIVKLFPSIFEPRQLLISYHIDRDKDKAKRMLEQASKDFPNHPDEFISLYDHLNPKDPTCVNYFKQSIRAEDPYSFGGLLPYLVSTTFDCARLSKCLRKRYLVSKSKEILKNFFYVDSNCWSK